MSDSVTAQSDHFIDQVVDGLTMCNGSISLELQPPHEQKMAELTIADAHALAAHKLDSNNLPFIEDLRIGFPTGMHDMLSVSNLFVNNFAPEINIPSPGLL
jgi:hypothetical protein